MNNTQLTIEYVDIGSITPYMNNAKLHPRDQIEQIKKSIEDYGMNDPIGVWQNQIVEGHGRLIACKELGFEKVPIIRLEHMTDEQRRAYMLVHNKTTMNSDFDEDLLSFEINGLADFDAEFYDFEIVLDEDEAEAADDGYEVELPEEPKAKLGDLYQLGDHRLICGDSTDPKVIERLMGGQKADMVFTDPPWNVDYGATQHPSWKQRSILNDAMDTESFKQFMSDSFECMNAACKAGAMVYVVMSAQEWGNLMLTLKDNGFHWSSTLIWNKDRLVLSRKDYHTKYEPIWYGWKDGEARLCPLKDRKQSDVWDFERPSRSDEHPTMKPIPLVAHAIKNSSKKGDVVLDQFGGSGTTLIACEETGRKCCMSELDPKYVDVIINRWEEHTGQKATLVD